MPPTIQPSTSRETVNGSDPGGADRRRAGFTGVGHRRDVRVPDSPSRFVRPPDWPQSSQVDLAVHDLPHESSTLEWWYVNAHVVGVNDVSYSLFASFFRRAIKTNEETGGYEYLYALTWSLIDADAHRYLSESLVDRRSIGWSLDRLDRGLGPEDGRIRAALRETLRRGNMPWPDSLMKGEAVEASDRLSLDFDGRTLEKVSAGRYRLSLGDSAQRFGCDLTFELDKEILCHGDDGLVSGSTAEDMFYYLCPRCSVSGALRVDGKEVKIGKGSLWYDHEFGVARNADLDADGPPVAWNWLSAQLEDGTEITVYDLFETEPWTRCGHHAVVVDPDGTRTRYDDFSFEGDRPWTSTRTYVEYPTRWRLRIPQARVEIVAEATFPEQEFVTLITKSPFWEGRVEIGGTIAGSPVVGVGIVERVNFGGHRNMDGFFAAVGQQTRRAIERVLPASPSVEAASALVFDRHDDDYLQGVDLEQYARALIAPIRVLTDRGGKSWRPYCATALCDAVGGHSMRFKDLLAFPELLHVGSLIIDDIQDASEIRRGGPACHMLHGTPLAINAGNMCYFLVQLFIERSSLRDDQKLRIYDLYFRALRAGHSGQALDISGLREGVPEAVATGDGRRLEDRVLAIHRLKSGVPASILGQIGVVIGDGSQDQVVAAGQYLEAIGVAFQIVDDVLNLRGFDNALKNRQEDLVEGKVTAPVAKAMSMLGRAHRGRLAQVLSGDGSSPEAVSEVSAMIERCGANDACMQLAQGLVETGWRRLEPLLRDSYFKMNLRAFGGFVLERQY